MTRPVTNAVIRTVNNLKTNTPNLVKKAGAIGSVFAGALALGATIQGASITLNDKNCQAIRLPIGK